MLVIHGIPRSRTFRCLWAAEESGLPYRREDVGFGEQSRSAAFRALNPNGKIPALTDGDLVLFESLAINLHIARRAGPPLLPEGDDASRVLQWTLWAATEVEPPAQRWAYNRYILPAERRLADEAAAGKAVLDLALGVLEQHLERHGPNLLGPGWTIADCNLAGVLYGSFMNGYDYAPFPATKSWLATSLERPAARRARALREG
jgi:glutathione S-transferase